MSVSERLSQALDNIRGPRYTQYVTTNEESGLETPDDEAWTTVLEEARTWRSVSFQNVALTDDHVKQLLFAAGQDEEDRRFHLLLRCDGVVFRDRIWFGNTHVVLHLSHCTFADEVSLDGTFENTVLDDITFARSALFANSTFVGETVFRNVRFNGGVNFYQALFEGDVAFGGVSFRRRASFQDATFEARVEFGQLVGDRYESAPATEVDSDHTFVLRRVGDLAVPTTFDDVSFRDSVLKGLASFEMMVTGQAAFPDVTFSQTSARIEAERIAFDGARFSNDVTLALRANQVSLVGARFERRFTIRFAGDLVADGAVFDAVGTVAGRPGAGTEIGRLLSLRASSVSKLTLADLDLSRCLFAHAYGLDELRIEASCTFAEPPQTLRFTDRRTIADENVWRALSQRQFRASPPWQIPSFDEWFLDRVGSPGVLDPAEIASLYRSLRKATESRKDEPGAADFYYGEMEMRRHAARPISAERLLLTAYWAVSGYALRATRALAALAVICVAFAFAFRNYGFVTPHSLGDMLIYSFGTSARVKTGFENDPLTRTGEVLHIFLGIVGPILYVLALLSLRGRVKR